VNTHIPHHSKSSLSTLLDGCSWQWYLGKVAGLPDPGGPATWRGTSVHAAIEHAERHRIVTGGHAPETEAVAVGLDALGREVEAGAPTDEVWARHGTNLETLAQQVTDAVANWYHAPLKGEDDDMSLAGLVSRWSPLAVEAGFNIPLATSPRTLKGFIDTVYWDPDEAEYVVVDLKTANRLDRWKSAEGHEREGIVYIHAAREAASLPPSGVVRMEWHVMRLELGKTARFEGARRVVFRPEPYHLGWALDDIRRADRILAEGLFAPDPSWNLCSPKWCPHFQGCQVTGELQPDRLAQAGRPATM